MATQAAPPDSGHRSRGDAWLREHAAVYDWRYAAAAAAAAAAALTLVLGSLAWGPEHAELLVRDPALVAHRGGPMPYYTGLLSHAGVLVWAAGAGLLALAARTSLPGRRALALVHGVAAALTAVLATDDLVLLHDGLLPVYLGLAEPAGQVAEAVVAAAWLLLSLRWLRHDPALPVLALAIGLLGASVLIDVTGDVRQDLEEAAKLAGIVCWSLWAWGTARWAVALAAGPRG